MIELTFNENINIRTALWTGWFSPWLTLLVTLRWWPLIPKQFVIQGSFIASHLGIVKIPFQMSKLYILIDCVDILLEFKIELYSRFIGKYMECKVLSLLLLKYEVGRTVLRDSEKAMAYRDKVAGMWGSFHQPPGYIWPINDFINLQITSFSPSLSSWWMNF